MAFDTKLVFNISDSSWLKSVGEPTLVNPPVFVYGDSETLTITFVRNVAGGVEIVSSATGLTVSISSGSGTPATSASGTGPDANGAFTVVLTLGTAGILSLVGLTAYIELKMGPPYKSYMTRCQIDSPINDGTVAATPAPDVAIGINAAKNTFLPKDASTDLNTGQTIFIVRASDGSLWKITWDANGQPISEPAS